MDRIRRALDSNEQRYQPLDSQTETETDFLQQISRDNDDDDDERHSTNQASPSFSYLEYGIFLLLGVSMLWAYNMFLAAGPYFQHRFKSNAWVLENFQAGEILASTATNLITMLILTRFQTRASYPKRILSSLLINTVIFVLLAVSTKAFLGISATGYFSFIMIMNLLTSFATSLCQNGIFAYVASFAQPSYTQGIMTGQAIAGVLPCVAQIVSVLSVPNDDGRESEGHPGDALDLPQVPSSAAMLYFLLATAVSVATLVAFIFLLRQRSTDMTGSMTSASPLMASPLQPRKAVPLRVLAYKLHWLAEAVFLTFAITMLFPVVTQRITSVHDEQSRPRILQPESFIPLAFLCWNMGDLLGRLLTAIPALIISHRPRLVFLLSIARLIFPALYLLCNLHGKGAVIESDFFYLVIVQGLYGLTNGYLGSICMIGAGAWVDEEEQEAAGSFMALCLVAGLTVGSLATFCIEGLW